ncbi:MAG: MgtC/SapB family protein [bacterium]|nr:MgtC/SapB family protein [bacterium]
MNNNEYAIDANEWLDTLVESIGTTPDDSVPLAAVVVRLLIACMIGWMIGQVFRRTYTGKKFAPTLPDTHVLLCLGGALIWLVVGNNLVRAFGLAGTIGLIRYRTRVRDPKDTTILLFSMVMGMACGLGHFAVALAGTAVVLAMLILLHVGHQRRSHRPVPTTGRPPPQSDDAQGGE